MKTHPYSKLSGKKSATVVRNATLRALEVRIAPLSLKSPDGTMPDGFLPAPQ
ncbi:hypothetical protein [Burkholderia sp. Ac-20353]|uniref:hypothetical protein n=1 Tax=Burkholderia sp. Ac-20353 TaxID=2703894 RepID=UPI00197B8D12|nr:hypothetical protein [Burkholderia sp. Ac-20353]MBN3793027.1 hypothetical protein [Burkholderia sp. Ac-20353]